MTIGLMIDLETLGKGPNAVAWQSALYGWDLADPETLFDYPHFQYLPIQPQLDMLPARRIDADTLVWWFKQVAENPGFAEAFDHCDSIDFGDLTAMLKSLISTFDRYTLGGKLDYELWTRGNFDLPILQTLLIQSGLPVFWDFRKAQDLRTLEKQSGVSYKDVAQPQGFMKYHAGWDCIFQIAHHTACVQALAKGK